MVLGGYGQPPVEGIQRRAFGDGPGFQYTVHSQAEIVVQT
jgi:hypothetical protein